MIKQNLQLYVKLVSNISAKHHGQRKSNSNPQTKVTINLFWTMTGYKGLKCNLPNFTVKSFGKGKKCNALKKLIFFLTHIKLIIRLTITGSSLFHTKEQPLFLQVCTDLIKQSSFLDIVQSVLNIPTSMQQHPFHRAVGTAKTSQGAGVSHIKGETNSSLEHHHPKLGFSTLETVTITNQNKQIF